MGTDLVLKGKKSGTGKLKKSLGSWEKGEYGIKISKRHKINTKKSFYGIIVFAPPGYGKTTGLYMNNLLSDKFPKSSKLITDLKGTIYDITHSYRESLGEECLVFEPLSAESQCHYNPLDFCNTFADIRDLANSILLAATKQTDANSENWITMALPLFTAMLLYVKQSEFPALRNIPAVIRILTTILKPTGNQIPAMERLEEKLMETGNEQIIEQFGIFMSCYRSETRSEATVGSILSTLLNRISVFGDPVIVENICDSTFSPHDLRKRSMNIYLKYDINKSDYLAPYLAVFYSQVLDKLMDMKDTSQPVYCMFDEIQQLGRVPKLDNISAFCRDFNIGLISAVQNYSKLADIYGDKAAQSIIANHATKLILPGNTDKFLTEWVSEMLDETEIERMVDKKEQHIKKRLFTPGEVRRLANDDKDNEDKVLIIAGHHQPILDDQDNWYKSKEYRKNQEV